MMSVILRYDVQTCFNRPMRERLVLMLTLAFFFATSYGCRNDRIQTYQVPKETPSAMTMPMGGAAPMEKGMEMPTGEGQGLPPGHPQVGAGMGGEMSPAGEAKEITWKVPKGWQEQPPSTMRVGSFLIKGENGQTADMSVIPLSGEAGGDLPNINRWRGQISLGPISEADLSSLSEKIHPAGREMLYVDFVSSTPQINNRFKKRLMAAIYHRQGRTWFFKMMGEDATVLSAKSAFIQFLKGIQFHET